ncbi:hypothetical protein VTH06DRAFT_6105 [Thermothelomyces fergusii]
MSAQDEVVRPLGPCEIYSSSRHSLGFYKCVANTCRYLVPSAKLRGRKVREILENAVARVALSIPSLGVGISGEDTSKPRFVQRPSINLDEHFEFMEKTGGEPAAHDAILLGILEDQHDRSWPDIKHRPPWKLIVIAWGTINEAGPFVIDAVFAAHHAIADGRSTALFHTALLRELNHPTDQPTPLSGRALDLRGVARGVHARPQEELVKFSTSWGFLARVLWGEFAPAWLQGRQPSAPWTGQAITLEPCRTRLRIVSIPSAAVPQILASCRANQSTLTPLLHALVLASLSRLISTEKATAFHSTTPIDLRPFIGDGSENGDSQTLFGVYVTAQTQTFDASIITTLRQGLSAEQIWEVAANLRSSMTQHLNNIPKDDIMSMLGWVSDWRGFWLSKMGKARQDTWEVSNIGSMLGQVPERNGGWKIQRSLMSQGATVAGAAISVSVSGVRGGDLGIVLGWQEGIVETSTVESLAADLECWLGRLGRGQDII